MEMKKQEICGAFDILAWIMDCHVAYAFDRRKIRSLNNQSALEMGTLPSHPHTHSVAAFSFQFQIHMACLVSNLPLPPLLTIGKQPFLAPLRKHTVSAIGGKQGRVAVIAKATSGSSESSTSLNIVESVQNVWDTPEDRIALFGLGFAFVVALWASLSVVTAIDKLPVVPGVFELIGILFSAWFGYRYLVFKPDREELVQIINKSVSDILGQ
ncbi:hypothetical protein L1887_19931 [Cichorium endivia]|nr:hypothetical protein L1887_19931 [Cichorium endivia]